MKSFSFKVLIVLFTITMGLWACQKAADLNPVAADDLKSSNQGTAWLQANSDFDQVAGTSPTKVNINVEDGSAQVSLSGGSAVVNRSGDYLIVAAPQATVPAGENFRCWLDVNGTYVANSNVLLSSEVTVQDVIVSQGIVSLEKGDVVSVYIASSGGAFIDAIMPPEGVLVPSIIFTMYQIN